MGNIISACLQQVWASFISKKLLKVRENQLAHSQCKASLSKKASQMALGASSIQEAARNTCTTAKDLSPMQAGDRVARKVSLADILTDGKKLLLKKAEEPIRGNFLSHRMK